MANPTHEEIAHAAYLNWIASGRPLFVDSITFANWIDAVINLEYPEKPPLPIPLPTE